MFGYLKPRLKTLSKEHKETYRAVYCGLCHILKKKSGYIGLASLNYELTALLILVLSLKNEKFKIFHGTCSITPFLRVPYLDYYSLEFEMSADLSVYTVSCKIKDNIEDEGKIRWKIADALFTYKTKSAAERLNQCANSIDYALKQYYELEHNDDSEFEYLLEANGLLLQSLIFPLLTKIDDVSKATALNIANLIGQWIYIIDACDDYKEDITNGRFNPLIKINDRKSVSNIVNELAYSIQTEIQKLKIYNYDYLVHHLFVEIVSETSNDILKKYKEEEI